MKQYGKFSVGSKVKILPSAVSVGVESEDVGKVGVVSRIDTDEDVYKHFGFHIQMGEICKARGYIPLWNVGLEMIELCPVRGEQLLFNFMTK